MYLCGLIHQEMYAVHEGTVAKNVLLSGATGFLGSVLRRQLVTAGHDVSTFGASGRGAPPGVRHFFIDDLASPEAHVRMLREAKPDWIFHIAGTSREDNIRNAYLVNCEWGGALLSAATRFQVQCRIMLLGSAAEYGPQRDNSDSGHGHGISEQTSCRPCRLYGITKLAQTLHALSLKDALPVVVARPFNIIGKGMPDSLALGRFVKLIKALPPHGGTLTTGPLGGIRDFVGVEECAATLLVLMAAPDAAGKVVNICSEIGTSMRDLLDLVIRQSQRVVTIQEATNSRTEPDVYVGRAAVLKMLGIQPPGADLPSIVGDMLNG